MPLHAISGLALINFRIMIKDGIPFVLFPLLAAMLSGFFELWILCALFLLLAAFMAFFFRNPHREIPNEPNVVVSAADGKVTRIEDREDGKFVSVFLSPFNVHINRAPIAGRVSNVKLFKGKKAPATSNKASKTNERNAVTIDGDSMTVVCTQIVGIVARRIVCWRQIGDTLELGERFGLIKFGSRTDLLMPKSVEILVNVGDKVKAGETIIAKMVK